MKENPKESYGQSWESWSNHVLITLEKLDTRVDNIEDQINQNNLKAQTDIVELKTRASIAAIIVSIVISVIIAIIGGWAQGKFSNNDHPDPPKDKTGYYYQIETLPQPKFTLKG